MVVLHVVYKKIKKQKSEEEALMAVAALSQTTIIPVDQTISLEAADFSLEYNLDFSDALVTQPHSISRQNCTQAMQTCGH